MGDFEDTSMNTETQPGQLERRAKPIRVRYVPDITLGNIAVVVSLLVTLLVAYGTYTRDQEKQDGRLLALEANQDKDKKEVKESLSKVEAAMLRMSDSLSALDKNVAVINAKTSNSK